jgi:hypothetical protein
VDHACLPIEAGMTQIRKIADDADEGMAQMKEVFIGTH